MSTDQPIPPTTDHPNPPPAITTTPTHPRTLRISTRSSALALAQTTLFTTLLPPTLPTSTHPLSTALGDTNKLTPLQTLASSTPTKSLWTSELETELLEGRVDVIVHSLKDVPTKLPLGLVVRAVGGREEGRDCVVLAARWRGGEGKGGLSGLEGLPAGSVVGTSSVRRTAMLRRGWPHLVVKDLRGNVPTRLRKLDNESEGLDAVVLAGAGMLRLGLGGRIAGWLDGRCGVLGAVGQGAIGVEWREGDEFVEGVMRETKGGEREWRVRWEGAGERELLRVLEGGCSVPLGVECVWEEGKDTGVEDQGGEKKEEEKMGKEGKEAEEEEEGKQYGTTLMMRTMVVSVDGKQCVEATRRQWVSCDREAEECGWQMAQEMVEKGAGEILKEIELNRAMIRGQDGA